MRPSDSKIMQDVMAAYGPDFPLYLQRIEMAVNALALTNPIETEVLFFAIQRDSGVNAETHYTSNADTNYLLGARDLGFYLRKFLYASHKDIINCENGERSINSFIERAKANG
jgi:hypothetical protein